VARSVVVQVEAAASALRPMTTPVLCWCARRYRSIRQRTKSKPRDGDGELAHRYNPPESVGQLWLFEWVVRQRPVDRVAHSQTPDSSTSNRLCRWFPLLIAPSNSDHQTTHRAGGLNVFGPGSTGDRIVAC
jgi:hypothetical protein